MLGRCWEGEAGRWTKSEISTRGKKEEEKVKEAKATKLSAPSLQKSAMGEGSHNSDKRKRIQRSMFGKRAKLISGSGKVNVQIERTTPSREAEDRKRGGHKIDVQQGVKC